MVTRNDDIAGLQLSNTRRAKSAVRDMCAPLLWTGLLALLVSIVAVMVLWLAPKSAADPPQYVLVTDVDDRQVCGELLPGSDATVRVRKADGSVVQWSEVAQVSAVDDCEQ